MRWLYGITFLACSFAVLASSDEQAELLTVNQVTLIQQTYSSAQLKLTLTYDGSMGERIGVGVMAHTQDSIKGLGFRPMSMRRGVNELIVEVDRPETLHTNSFMSHSLDLQLYTGDIIEHVLIPFELQWPSFVERFGEGHGNLSAPSRITSIEGLLVNESLIFAQDLIREVLAFGLTPDKIQLFSKPLDNPNVTAVSIRIHEGVGLGDLQSMLKLLAEHDVKIKNIAFLPQSYADFRYASVEIIEQHYDGLGVHTQEIVTAIQEADLLSEVYHAAAFSPEMLQSEIEVPSDVSEFNLQQSNQALDVLGSMILAGNWHPKLLLIFAKVYAAKFGLTLGLVGLFLLLLVVCSVWVYRRWFHLPAMESLPIDIDDPLWQQSVSIAQQNLARFKAAVLRGKAEPVVLLAVPNPTTISQQWAIVHALVDDRLIVSDELTLSQQPGLKRRTICCSEVLDWMLCHSDDSIEGGFSVQATSLLYLRKYGQIPTRYRAYLQQFTDFTIEV